MAPRYPLLILVACASALGQAPFESFEVAAIKSTPPGWNGGRFMGMQTAHEMVIRNYTLKSMIAAAFNVSFSAIQGGPAWVDTDHFDILAKTPAERRPNLEEQMTMLRALLIERFQLKFHREEKEMSVYAITVAKGGPKLIESKIVDKPEGAPPLTFLISRPLVRLPAKSATISELAWIMQRTALDRPVLDKTGLTGRYDFDLEWSADQSQFGGVLGSSSEEATKPGLFAAMQQQLGLKLEATRSSVQIFVFDYVERPSDN